MNDSGPRWPPHQPPHGPSRRTAPQAPRPAAPQAPRPAAPQAPRPLAPQAARPATPQAPRPIPRPAADPTPRVNVVHHRRRSPWLPLSIGALVLLLIGGVVSYHFIFSRAVVDAPTGPATTASDAVAGYLHALADGDIEQVLDYGQSRPANKQLLSNEVLTESRRLGRVGDIKVTREESATATSVSAHYEVGVEPVDATIKVTPVDGQWRLLESTGSLTVNSTAMTKGVPVVVNGVTLKGFRDIPVLPGRYHITTTHPRVMYANNPEFLVATPGESVNVDHLPLTLSDHGRQEVIAAARHSLTQCLARQELAPAQCPIAVQSSRSGIIPTTIKWTLVNDPFAGDITEEWSGSRLRVPTQLIVRLQAKTTTGSTINQELTFNTTVITDPVGEKLSIAWG